MESKKVLLIEGESAMSEKLTPLLEEQKCTVTAAKGGLSGINSAYQQKPDIIFLDSSISDISNYQVCKLLKNNYDFRNTPVVIIGESERGSISLFSIGDGAADYIDISQDLDGLNQQVKGIIVKYQKSFIVSKSFKLIEELNETIRILSSHYSRTKDLNFKELNGLFEEVVYKFTSVMNSEIGSLMLIDEESGHLYIKAAKGLKEEIVYKAKVKIGEGIAGWVVNKGKPILVTDIEKDSRFSKMSNGKYYTKSLLSAPLKFGNLRGVININNKSTKEAYNEKDLTLLGVLINQLHFALENSNLFRKLEDRDKELQKLTSDKKILTEINKLLDKELYEITISYEINKILNSDLDYKQTINAVIELIESTIDYHFCGLLLLDSLQGAELMVSIKYPASEFDLAAFKAKTVDTYYKLSGYDMLLERIALNRTDGPAILVSEDKKNKDVLSSFHALPLNIKNKNLGLLAVSHSALDAFGPEEIKLLSIIASHSVIAINNALLHKKIKELSVTDGLTGLHIYRFFQDRLDEELKRAQRYQEPLALIMVDIDGFKNINDSCGHLAGDEILKEISQIFKKVCREIDVITRYGGEEFAIILPETDKEGAFYVAERLRKAIKNYEFKSPHNEPIKLTVSCGVSSYPESAKEKEALIKKTDDALYQAKNEGKNKTSLN